MVVIVWSWLPWVSVNSQLKLKLQREGYHRILVADGHSTDGTPGIAGKLGAIVMTQEEKGKRCRHDRGI
jgi:hypothetical protein